MMAPVHGMRIYGDESSLLEFDAYSAGVPALAWIVEDARLQAALWRDLEFVGGECRAMRIEQDSVTLSLDGRSIHPNVALVERNY